ncbi:MAG: DUF134 domain-containing protein [Patescibacteria group bacterium]|jgi:predicted DNA-binding protein (UPF0251 family)
MRGRPKRKRLIGFNPEITYFKPAGVPLRNLSEEVLTLDEVEAIRLADLNDLDQEEAAKKMGVSRITFLRIVHAAHRKIAASLIYGKAIKMKGGDYIMPNLDGTGPLGQGPQTGRGMGVGRGRGRGQGLGGTAECLCPKCSEKVPHQRGVPCIQTKCPKCDCPMAGVFCRPQ